MLDESTRSAIFRLQAEGHGTRAIANVLGIARGSVKTVIRAGQVAIPSLTRAEKAEPHRQQILDLLKPCKNNLVRVHEELVSDGAALSYTALTAFCRRHGIGHTPILPAGQYDHRPGEEMQHDTSPHKAMIGGRMRSFHTASLVLCFCRMGFAQCYPRFSRFVCKMFLTDGIEYFEGACACCMIDNTHVVVLSGSGATMVPVPEMVSFGERFGFAFRAHEIGDADRSGKVERPFHYIEHNFFAGREFESFADLNAQLRAWCDRSNATYRRHLHGSPRDLFVTERAAMKPLPIHVPEVYNLHSRFVDTEGFINLHRNRYTVPYQLIGRRLEVRESKHTVDLFDGPRLVATHNRVLESEGARIVNPAHRPKRHEGVLKRVVSEQERKIRERLPAAGAYIELMKTRSRGSVRDLRWLLRMIDEYPRDAMSAALDEALAFGMTDLERLERMVLRRVANDYFVLPRRPDGEEEDDE